MCDFPRFLATFPKKSWISGQLCKICSVFGVLCVHNIVVFMRKKSTKVQPPMIDLWIRPWTRHFRFDSTLGPHNGSWLSRSTIKTTFRGNAINALRLYPARKEIIVTRTVRFNRLSNVLCKCCSRSQGRQYVNCIMLQYDCTWLYSNTNNQD